MINNNIHTEDIGAAMQRERHARNEPWGPLTALIPLGILIYLQFHEHPYNKTFLSCKRHLMSVVLCQYKSSGWKNVVNFTQQHWVHCSPIAATSSVFTCISAPVWGALVFLLILRTTDFLDATSIISVGSECLLFSSFNLSWLSKYLCLHMGQQTIFYIQALHVIITYIASKWLRLFFYYWPYLLIFSASIMKIEKEMLMR